MAILPFQMGGIISYILGVIIFVFIFYIIIKTSSSYRDYHLSRGTRAERTAIKHLGTISLAISGRGLLRLFRWGIKGSGKLARMGKKAGRKAGKLGKNYAIYVSKLIKGEQENIEVEFHEASAAAASVELANVIGKLSNAEIRDRDAKKSIELRIRLLAADLESLANRNEIDAEAHKFIQAVAAQIISGLVNLAHHEEFETQARKKSFKEVYKLLKAIVYAETAARRIEAKAVRNQDSLTDYIKKDIKDLQRILQDRKEQERQKVRAARSAYNKSQANDKFTKAALYNQIKLGKELSRSIQKNMDILIDTLGELSSINSRMIHTLRKIRNDVKDVLQKLKSALDMEKDLQDSEKQVEADDKLARASAKTAEINYKSILGKGAEDIIIELTNDAGNILSQVKNTLGKVTEIDKNKLIPMLKMLNYSMEGAYQVEEA
jgi:hypothetical protein